MPVLLSYGRSFRETMSVSGMEGAVVAAAVADDGASKVGQLVPKNGVVGVAVMDRPTVTDSRNEEGACYRTAAVGRHDDASTLVHPVHRILGLTQTQTPALALLLLCRVAHSYGTAEGVVHATQDTLPALRIGPCAAGEDHHHRHDTSAKAEEVHHRLGNDEAEAGRRENIHETGDGIDPGEGGEDVGGGEEEVVVRRVHRTWDNQGEDHRTVQAHLVHLQEVRTVHYHLAAGEVGRNTIRREEAVLLLLHHRHLHFLVHLHHLSTVCWHDLTWSYLILFFPVLSFLFSSPLLVLLGCCPCRYVTTLHVFHTTERSSSLPSNEP